MKENKIKHNSYYEGLIQNLYAGTNGCFVCFMQFFYQFNLSDFYKKELKEAFKFLYLNELENCKILCEILLELGGDNKYYSCEKKYLSGIYVNYSKNFEKIFLEDVECLEINIIDVKGLIYKIEDLKIKNKLKIILENKKNSLKNLKESFFKNNLI